MKVSDQLHIPTPSSREQGFSLAAGHETGWIPEPAPERWHRRMPLQQGIKRNSSSA